MKGAVRTFLGQRPESLTRAAIAESDRLRAAVQRHALTVPELARAGRCSRRLIRDWMAGRVHLPPLAQEGIRLVYTTETGGPA